MTQWTTKDAGTSQENILVARIKKEHQEIHTVMF